MASVQRRYAEFRTRLMEAGLGSHADVLLEHAAPARRWGGELASDDAGAAAHIEVGASKLGGSPDLAADTPWPRREGRPLAFVAQIDLAEVAVDLEEGGPLPPKGLLSLFVATEDLLQPGNRDVVFIEAGVGLTRLQAPGALAVHERFAAVRWHPEPELTGLPSQSEALYRLGLSQAQRAATTASSTPTIRPSTA